MVIYDHMWKYILAFHGVQTIQRDERQGTKMLDLIHK